MYFDLLIEIESEISEADDPSDNDIFTFNIVDDDISTLEHPEEVCAPSNLHC